MSLGGVARVKYTGATPGADANTYNLFTTVDGQIPQNFFPMSGYRKLTLNLAHSQPGILRAYKSPDRGVTWNQMSEYGVGPASSVAYEREYLVEALQDFKLDWINGGIAQGTWEVDIAIDEQRIGFQPTNLSGLVLWLRADLGITLGATLKATGTTPPAATISGTPNGLCGLHIEIDNAGGARGTATFKWSLDNGVTYQVTGVLTAATTVLGTTGITVAWPVGTYNADNKYDATVSQWNDQSGIGNHVTQGTATLQPVINVNDSTYAGKPSLSFSSSAMARTFGAQVAQPVTHYIVGEGSVNIADYRVFFDGIGATNRHFADYEVTTGKMAMYAGAQLTSTLTGGGKAVISLVANGGSSAMYVSSLSALVSGAGGSVPLDGITIGSGFAQTGAFLNGKITEYAMFTGAHSAASRARMMAYLANRYGATLS